MAAPVAAPRGLTPAMWLMMVGVLIVGLLGGLFLGRMNQPPPAPPAPPPSGAPRSEAPTAKPAPRTVSAALRGDRLEGAGARPADAPNVTL